jgi:hypothetical protein
MTEVEQSNEACYRGLGLRLRMTRAVLGLTEQQLAAMFRLKLGPIAATRPDHE